MLLGGARGLARTDPAAAFLGGIKGDEATYIAIAASLAYDGDLRFAPEDLAWFRDRYDGGPEGIFLKRGGDGALWFGKAFVHGALAAPFVRVFGFAGLLVFNVTCLLVVIAAGTWWLAPRAGTGRAAAFAAAFVAASVAPVYAAWLTSDLVTFTLVFCAFCLGVPRAGEIVSTPRLASALVLLALATFSKPIVLPLVAPLALASARPWSWRAAGIVAIFGALVAALFAANGAVTGEANYQGGDRRTFYGRFPFDDSRHDVRRRWPESVDRDGADAGRAGRTRGDGRAQPRLLRRRPALRTGALRLALARGRRGLAGR